MSKVLRVLFVAVLILTNSISKAQDNKKQIFRFPIKETIAPTVMRSTWLALQQAKALKADYIVIEMDTYGGLVDAADSIRTMILRSEIPVFVLIQNNAASAGALISLACDSIYMMPGSTIGAATVVDQSGNQVPDKYQSYMRKKMRATAEQNGRNPDIAEAMVDPDIYIEGVSDSGKVVTFTVKEAIQFKFCEAEVKSIDEALKHAGITNYEIKSYESTLVNKVIGFLINPAISGLLILLIIGGIYFELQTPGIGFPIAAAIVGAVLYFAPLYLEGLAANWEILIFIIGLVLLGLEIFVTPGFGVLGISGILLLIFGLGLSLVPNNGFTFPENGISLLTQSFAIVLTAVFVGIGLSIFMGGKLISSNIFGKAVLRSELKAKANGNIVYNKNLDFLIGEIGITQTPLMPSGKIEINGNIYEGKAIYGSIDSFKNVEIKHVEGNWLFVVEQKNEQ